MALYVLQPGIQPLGQFDFLDTDLPNVKGGELATWDEASRVNTLAEKAAFDAKDGYVADQMETPTFDATATRPVLKLASASSTGKAIYLTDDGIAGYGTVFGTLIGAPVGLGTSVAGGVVLGPSTARASGKVTVWDKEGLYAVSLDAVHSDATVLNGTLASGLDTPLPGDVLYVTSSGKICRSAISTAVKAAVFIEMSGNGSLVTTPGKLIGASETFDRIKIQFLGAQKNV